VNLRTGLAGASSEFSRSPAVTPRVSVLRNVLWMFSGNAFLAFCQWITVVFLAQIDDDPRTVGLFALALAVTWPVIVLTTLALRTFQVTDARRKYSFAEYITLRGVSVIVAVVAISGIANLRYSGETAWVIVLFGIAKAVDGLSDICQGAMQQAERLDLVGRSMVLTGVLSLIGLPGGMLLTGSFVLGSVGLIGANLVVLCVYNLPQALRTVRQDLLRHPDFSQAWRSQAIGALAWGAVPLALAHTLSALIPNTPRFFIEADPNLGQDQLGIFAALAYTLIAGQTVLIAVAQTLLPRLSALRAARDFVGYRRMMTFSLTGALTFGVLCTLAAYVVGGPVLGLIFGPRYAARTDVLLALALGTACTFPTSLIDSAISSAQRFTIQLPIIATSLACSTLACAFWVPEFGLVGAAWSLFVALFINLLLKILVLIQVFRVDGSM
jgi:O-antigen/teichoic acid export membrane protein